MAINFKVWALAAGTGAVLTTISADYIESDDQQDTVRIRTYASGTTKNKIDDPIVGIFTVGNILGVSI